MSFRIFTAMLPLILLKSPLLCLPETQIQYAPHSLYQASQKKTIETPTSSENSKPLSEPAFSFVDTTIPSKSNSNMDPRDAFLTDYLVLTTVGLAQLAGATAALAKDDKPKSATDLPIKKPEHAKEVPNFLPRDARPNSQLQFNFKFELAFSQNEDFQIRPFVIRPDGWVSTGQAFSSTKIQAQLIETTPLIGVYTPGLEILNKGKTTLVITNISGVTEIFSLADSETEVLHLTQDHFILPPKSTLQLNMDTDYNFTVQ